MTMQIIGQEKFLDMTLTAKGEARASVELQKLDTLWFLTGTLCNIECANCYIESSPKNDRLSYLGVQDVEPYLNEIRDLCLETQEIAFTGGEPFMNPAFLDILELSLSRGFEVLILSNAMAPMMRQRVRDALTDLKEKYPQKIKIRVSLDHYSAAFHDAERGDGAFEQALLGLRWLSENDFQIDIAGRSRFSESESVAREGYQNLCSQEGFNLDCSNPAVLVIFPEMDENADVPEITTACWEILNVSPGAMMCSNSRMVVKRKGEATTKVMPCTLLPYDTRFVLGETLEASAKSIFLNHPHCAKFCVLGGGACSV